MRDGAAKLEMIEQLHVTVAFLGETTTRILGRVDQLRFGMWRVIKRVSAAAVTKPYDSTSCVINNQRDD